MFEILEILMNDTFVASKNLMLFSCLLPSIDIVSCGQKALSIIAFLNPVAQNKMGNFTVNKLIPCWVRIPLW